MNEYIKQVLIARTIHFYRNEWNEKVCSKLLGYGIYVSKDDGSFITYEELMEQLINVYIKLFCRYEIYKNPCEIFFLSELLVGVRHRDYFIDFMENKYQESLKQIY